MGSYDRQYMQPTDAGPRAPWTMTTKLLVANVVAFLVVRASVAWFRYPLDDLLALDLDNLARGRVWTLVTAAFVHGSGWHLVGNMLSLWFFGRFYEDRRGGSGLLVTTFLVAVAAHLPHLVANALGSPYATIGFSGVNAALLAFAAFREPYMPVRLLFVTLPLWGLAAIFVAMDLLPALGLTDGAGTSYWVHLGGYATGWVLHHFDWSPRVPDVAAWRERRRRLGEARTAERERAEEAALRDRVDELLGKVSEHGLDSLTPAERDFLRESSKRYR